MRRSLALGRESGRGDARCSRSLLRAPQRPLRRSVGSATALATSMPHPTWRSAPRAKQNRRWKPLCARRCTIEPLVTRNAASLRWVRIGEHSAKSFASQGQQRALVLAWKIAEIENLHQTLGYLPLLLLDDVSSELDRDRNSYLMSYLSGSGAQVFLTTTAKELVAQAASSDTQWCEIRSGRLQLIDPPSA